MVEQLGDRGMGLSVDGKYYTTRQFPPNPSLKELGIWGGPDRAPGGIIWLLEFIGTQVLERRHQAICHGHQGFLGIVWNLIKEGC
jgi:hypothetical protein